MKMEVMVDKDNTHFSYKFDCDKVIDGSKSRITGGGADDNAKLVILKDDKTIAVFNVWTFWRIIEDNAEKCKTCGRFEKLGKDGRCQKCQE